MAVKISSASCVAKNIKSSSSTTKKTSKKSTGSKKSTSSSSKLVSKVKTSIKTSVTNKSTTKIVEKSTKQTSHASSQLRCSSQTTSKLNSNTVKEVISGQIKKRSTYLTDAPKLYNSSGSVIVAEDYNSYGNKEKSDVTKSKLDSKPIINKVELENSAESKIEVFRINTDKAEKSGITSNTIQASKKVTTVNCKVKFHTYNKL